MKGINKLWLTTKKSGLLLNFVQEKFHYVRSPYDVTNILFCYKLHTEE
jgi:hypothetical protein